MHKILLIDDSPTVLKLMSASLACQGYQVMTAINGTMGLEMAAREKPAVVVLDVNLPDINGLEVLSRMRGDPELQDIPVVLLTGQDDTDLVHKGMSMGAAGFLPKHSTSPKVLCEKLKALLGV
jgi:two-component system alkaline phosphatase synthesis response regulator PhoP